MEEILEAPLFVRSKKKVALTAAGRYLKGEIEFLLNHLELTKKQLKRIHEGNFGEIRIGFLGSAMQNVIPELLLKLKKGFSGNQDQLGGALQQFASGGYFKRSPRYGICSPGKGAQRN